MSSFEKIHPELTPENIPKSVVPQEGLKITHKGDNVFSIEKARRVFGKKTMSFKKESASEEQRKDFLAYDSLVKKYSCGIDAKPLWCIWGKNSAGDQGVLFWIKPASEDERVARTLAELMNKFGGQVRVEKTEWNETLSGKPIYSHSKALEL
ncbi:MAG: hypothetical protein Q8R36_00350 [bacterium]|nr:hypothetical protein [bacterium]